MNDELAFHFFMENIKKANNTLTFFGRDVVSMTKSDLMATVASLAERVPDYGCNYRNRSPRHKPAPPKEDTASGYTVTVIGGTL
jgi:hypothetical protein